MAAVTSGLVEWAVAGMALAGQVESGDRHLVTPTPEGMLVAVVDGLGHGSEAAEAAEAAVECLQRDAGRPVISLIQRCHASLTATRGAVMSLAAFNMRDETMTWLGIGSVEGVLLRAQATVHPRREFLLLRGGVVGAHLPALSAAILPIGRGDTVILATDGVRNDFADHLLLSGPAQQVADRIVAHSGTRTDDALVVVARYRGPA
jgi:phosphoserine phosphatase RsbX